MFCCFARLARLPAREEMHTFRYLVSFLSVIRVQEAFSFVAGIQQRCGWCGPLGDVSGKR